MRGWRGIFFLFVLVLATGCLPNKAQKELVKWNVTLEKDGKLPYGTWLAYQSLRHYFPGAEIEPVSHGFRYTDMDDKMKFNVKGHTLLILEGLDFKVSDEEWKELKQEAYNGNEILLFCSRLDEKIEEDLGCYKERKGEEEQRLYSVLHQGAHRDVLTITNDTGRHFGYNGRTLGGFFTFANDTDKQGDSTSQTSDAAAQIYDVLGYANDRPNVVRYRIGEGHITLHAAPLVLSNYFLLQDGNEQYLSQLLQTLPENISRVYWDDYFRRSAEVSSFDVLWRYPASKWALRLGIFALLVYVLFEGKRKQRIIPIIPPIKNDSVSFVETVGRLYYNKGNHNNLAEKMVQQFLEWVRAHYFLNTNLLNENFIQGMTIKSGQPEATVRGLMDMIHEIKLGDAKIDDAYLYQLYNTIQRFYFVIVPKT